MTKIISDNVLSHYNVNMTFSIIDEGRSHWISIIDNCMFHDPDPANLHPFRFLNMYRQHKWHAVRDMNIRSNTGNQH